MRVGSEPRERFRGVLFRSREYAKSGQGNMPEDQKAAVRRALQIIKGE